MAIEHAVSGQSIDASPLGARLGSVSTHAVFKARDLEVMRLVLLAGKGLPPHKVPGEVTILCVEGRLEISLPQGRSVLGPGQLMLLSGGEVHGVTALEDASALVTVALRK